jgi:hypothetical protein
VYRHRLVFMTVVTVAALALQATAPALAANGLAFDSVTKLIMNATGSTAQPGDFAADFQAASQAAPSHGGMFGKLQNVAEGAMAMMHTGTAERHFVAGSRSRTDIVALQTATIVDCSARTITSLDLKAKTYRVDSLDHPQHTDSSGGSNAPAATPTSDGSKIAVAMTTTSLGPKQVDSVNTNGYSTDMKVTVTKPGQSPQTSDVLMTAYYTAMTTPLTMCPAAMYDPATRGRSGAPGAGASSASYDDAMRAMSNYKGNINFAVTWNGPMLPFGNLALWQLVTMQGQSSTQGQSVGFLTERGNVRTIADNDPIFSVPSDFTQQN